MEAKYAMSGEMGLLHFEGMNNEIPGSKPVWM